MTTRKTFHLFSICCSFKTKNLQSFRHFPGLDLFFAVYSQLHKFPLQILRLFLKNSRLGTNPVRDRVVSFKDATYAVAKRKPVGLL